MYIKIHKIQKNTCTSVYERIKRKSLTLGAMTYLTINQIFGCLACIMLKITITYINWIPLNIINMNMHKYLNFNVSTCIKEGGNLCNTDRFGRKKYEYRHLLLGFKSSGPVRVAFIYWVCIKHTYNTCV